MSKTIRKWTSTQLLGEAHTLKLFSSSSALITTSTPIEVFSISDINLLAPSQQ